MYNGFLEFGIGDTREDAKHSTIASRMRGHESSKNLGWQHYLIDSIPSPGYRDYALHKEVRETFACQLEDPDTKKRNEVFSVQVEKYLIEELNRTKDFEPIRQWISKNVRKCAAKLNPNHVKQSVNIRNVQSLVIKKIISALREKGLVTNFVCELAARIGKTILFLSLAKEMQEEFGHKAMFVMAYGVGLSVKTSYKDECAKYSDFDMMQFIDAADKDSNEQYSHAIANGKMPIVFISLNPDAEEKYEWINQLTGTYIALLEETDFGTHTDSQVGKVDYILENKTATRINASGTNIGRLAKAFGKNSIDEIISIPYCMVEQDPSIPNVVKRRFYNMLFNPKMNKLLEDFDKDILPNITKILSKPLSQQKFISALFQDIFGYQPIYGLNISDCAGEEIKHSMLFVNTPKQAMEQLADVIEKACPEHKVLVLNGHITNNKEAEGLTKEELIRLRNNYYKGRDKLLVITNMMGTRSYSIPEIQASLFMQEGGDIYPYMQKYSRTLTPGCGKKYGHIFDFSFDQRKTRNTVMSVAVEAALLMQQKGKTYPDAVREVLNSVNIKDMVSGSWISADEVIKQFEDNNKLLEIANAHTRVTIEDLTDEDFEDLSELAKRFSGTKIEKSKIDKIIETGKTFGSGKTSRSKVEKDRQKAIVEKAVRMINGSASTVLALTNYKGESFLECIDIIENNIEMHQEFVELYGIKPSSIKRLSPSLEISTLDIIVRMSKYNKTQKHIENNSLTILKDDATLWFDIFGNRAMKRFIKSKHCKKILVVAGGHGTEVDTMVELFGVDIIKKLVYNDKYSFLCNQIKRKYPNLKIFKGDFLELDFKMKFDIVLGNPPYTNSIWKKFLEKMLNLSDNIIVSINPDSSNNATSEGTRLTELFQKNGLQFKKNCADKFKINMPSTSYFIFDKNKKPQMQKTLSAKIKDKVLSKKVDEISISYGKTEKKPLMESGAYSDNENSIHSKPYIYSIDQSSVKTGFIKKGSDKGLGKTFSYRGKGIITYRHFAVNKNTPIYEIDDISKNAYSNNIYVISLDDKESKAGFESVYLSKLYKCVLKELRGDFTWTRSPLIKMLPKLDLSRVWTDAELYAYFGLTQEEIDYIEATVK